MQVKVELQVLYRAERQFQEVARNNFVQGEERGEERGEGAVEGRCHAVRREGCVEMGELEGTGEKGGDG